MFVPFLLILPFGAMARINEFPPSRKPVKRGSRSCNTAVHYLDHKVITTALSMGEWTDIGHAMSSP